jgi:flagellar biosynthesis anti-sigma factor FlgM
MRGVVRDFPGGRSQAATADRVDRSDSSGITGQARELAGALQIVGESDDVRAERVAALKAQIANGTYNPDPREIARKLVERGF